MLNFRAFEAMTHAEFSEALFSFIGNSYYNREQSYLLFHRYDKDMDGRINYREFCRLIVPNDRVLSSLLCGRSSVPGRVTQETQEVFKRLLRAHLNLEQAHEYLKQRLSRTRGSERWSL